MKRFIVYLLLIICCLALPGSGVAAEKIRVGYSNNPPLSIHDSEGAPQGLSVDIFNAIAHKQGWDIVWELGPTHTLLRQFKEGNLDVHVAVPFDYELTADFNFTTNSIVADWGALYTRGLGISNIQDLDGRRIGFASDDRHVAVFKGLAGGLGVNVTLVSFDSYRDVLTAVANGEVDAGIANRLFGLRYGDEFGVEASPVLFNPVSIRFAVSQSAPPHILSELNAELGKIKADGESVYYESLKFWLSPENLSGNLLKSPYFWIGTVALLILSIFSFWLVRRLSATSSEVSRQEEALQEETEVRKRAQVALWESVERHRAMFTDNMLPQLLVNAEDYHIVEVNPSADKFYGFSPNELVGMMVSDINADPPARIGSFMEKIKLGTNRILTRHRLADGTVRDVELFISTLLIRETEHNLVTVVDISERMAAERARMASEERLELAVKGGDLAFWDWDIKTECLTFNERYAELIGYAPDEMVSSFSEWLKFVHPGDIEDLRTTVALSLSGDDSARNTQFRMRTKSGEWRWFVMRGRVTLRSEAGEPLRMSGITYDVTERKQTEDRLANINACVLDFGPDSNVNISSLTALVGKMLGGRAAFYSRAHNGNLKPVSAWNIPAEELNAEIIGGHLSHNLLRRNKEALSVSSNLMQTPFVRTDPDVLGLGISTYIGQIVRVNMRPAGVLCIVFSDDYVPSENDEKIFGIIVAAIQVEEERNLSAQQLVEAKNVAESANMAKSEFLANMSHEIRTPLNGVFGMLQLVAETNLDEEQQDYVSTALTSGRSLLQVINDVLDFSKMEAGMLALENDPFDFRQLVSSVLDNFTVQASEKDLSMSVDIDADLPPLLLGDEGRIRQVLFNLVGNAVKFTPAGDVSVSAFLALPDIPERPSRLVVTVTDTGIGIPDDMIDSVFSAFSQADGSHTRNYGGTGLGLSIVKRLINLMGGEISVEGDENGTKIHFFVNVEGNVAPVNEVHSVPVSVNIKPLAVLLAEDERVNRISVQRHLEKLGHTVTAAKDGEQALELLLSNDYDLILMDIQMPNIDGLTATKLIRNDATFGHKADIPIVALTAHAMKGDREEFLAAGMNDYLAKPVEFVDLVRVLVSVLPPSGRE